MKLRLSLYLACHNGIWNVSIYANDKGTARNSRKLELGPISYQLPISSQIGVYTTISLFGSNPVAKLLKVGPTALVPYCCISFIHIIGNIILVY